MKYDSIKFSYNQVQECLQYNIRKEESQAKKKSSA